MSNGTTSVKFAVGLPTVGPFGAPHELVELAVAAERAGWDGVFLWDHLLWRDPTWPVANSTAVLGAVAAVTSRVRLAVLMNAAARRRPAQLAAETATLDVLSDGRMIFGGSLGSYPDEWSRLGEDADARVRADRLDECLAVIDELWSGQEVHHRGRYVTVDGVRMALRPVQRPRVPVWIGGTWPARRPFRRAARWDGVMPTHRDYGSGRTMPAGVLGEVVRYVAEHREPDAPPFDVALEGRTDPGGADTVAPYAEAGLTWWIEAFGWWRDDPATTLARTRERIAAGPR